MTEFGSDERRLFEALRVDEAPSREDRDRVRAGIASRIGVAAITGATTATATVGMAKTAAAAPGTIMGMTAASWLKVGAMMVTVGMGVGAVAFWSEPESPSGDGAPQMVENIPLVVEPVERSEPVVELAPEEPEPVEETHPSPQGQQKSVPRIRKTDLQGELKLLGAAQSALKNGNASVALQALDEHSRKYPVGALSVERSGVRAIALCVAGQESRGRSAATQFLKKNPNSPLAGRVRTSCFSSAK